MQEKPLFSIVIVSLNGSDVLPGCLQSLRESQYQNREVIVVNNGSTDSTAAIVREQFPEVQLLDLPKNHGFAGGNNQGIRASRGEIVLLLNDDTICTPSMIDHLIQPFLNDPKTGIAGCKILYPDRETIQHAGAEILANGCTRHIGYREQDHGQYNEPCDVDYVTGCAMAIRRSLFQKIGLLDDRYFPIYFEEIEFAVRAKKAGSRVVYCPQAVLYHLESKTEVIYSQNFFFRMHRGRWRFILKNFSAKQICRVIKPELRYIRYMGKWKEGRALLRAYFYILIRLPIILYDRNHRFIPLDDPCNKNS